MWQTWKSPGIIACSTLVEGLRTSGNIEDELRLDVKMLKEGVLLDSVTFNYLLQDDTRVGRPVEAYKLRLLASSKGLDADVVTYNILVAGTEFLLVKIMMWLPDHRALTTVTTHHH